MYSQIIVPGASTFHHRACRKKESLFKTTMWLICRPRCNVLPTFVLPCLCIFGSTPTPSCPCRASSADTLFQPKTGHVLFSLANFLSPHCLRWETLAGATSSAVASKCDRHLCIAPPADAPNPASAVSYVVCRLQFSAPRTPSKLINTLQEHPAQFETTSCCQEKGPLRFVADNPLNAFFQAAKLNHTRKHQLRPCEVAKPCFKPPATATSRKLRRTCHQ